MIIKFGDINCSLGTRILGSEIRYSVIHNLSTNADEIIVFDFTDVEVVSNSFADECFGKLLDEFGLEATRRRTTFMNANPFVSHVIKNAINNRLSKNKRAIATV